MISEKIVCINVTFPTRSITFFFKIGLKLKKFWRESMPKNANIYRSDAVGLEYGFEIKGKRPKKGMEKDLDSVDRSLNMRFLFTNLLTWL